MPNFFPPRLLEDPETRAFCLQRQIMDVNSLGHYLLNSVCLSVDIEGCEGTRGGITAIGLAILPPIDVSATPFPSPPFSTEQLVDRYQIESYCFYVEGCSRRKSPPAFPYGHDYRTSDPGLDVEIIVDGIKQRYASKDIILIGWHSHPLDLPAIQTLAPRLFTEVAGWVDVVDVMRQLCFSKQEDLMKSWPPLGDLMLCVGLAEECIPPRWGCDAVHTVIVLARLLTLNPHEGPLEVRRRRPIKQRGRQEQGLRGCGSLEDPIQVSGYGTVMQRMWASKISSVLSQERNPSDTRKAPLLLSNSSTIIAADWTNQMFRNDNSHSMRPIANPIEMSASLTYGFQRSLS